MATESDDSVVVALMYPDCVNSGRTTSYYRAKARALQRVYVDECPLWGDRKGTRAARALTALPGSDSRVPVEAHRRLRTGVHAQREHVGAGVVPDRVEHATARRRSRRGRARRNEPASPSGGRRPRRRPGRRSRVAPRHQVVLAAVEVGRRPGRSRGDVGAAQEAVTPMTKHPALLGDVAQRRHPLVAVVPGRRERTRRPARTSPSAPAACSSPSRSARRPGRTAMSTTVEGRSSPLPHTSRSAPVGTSLRCATSDPPGADVDNGVVERVRA